MFMLFIVGEAFPQIQKHHLAVIKKRASGVAPFYTLDFEEGDLSDWTHIGANSVSAEDIGAHSGTYGMGITSSSGDVNYYTFASGMDSVYVTFWIYVPSTTGFDRATYGYSTWVYTSNTTTVRSIFGGHITDTGGGYRWSTWMMGSSDGTFADNSTNFSYDEWHQIKIYYKKGATSYHKIWVDGDLALNSTAAHNEVANGFSVCIYQPSAGTDQYIYWDDINFYTTDPDL